jgi:hypothetical protein
MKELNEKTMKLLEAYYDEYVSANIPSDPNEMIEHLLSRLYDYAQFASTYDAVV